MKMFTTVDDFGTHVAALSKAAPFPFRYPGRLTLGLRLAKAHIVNSTDGRGKEWLGLAVGITYSSKPEALGTGDREFTLTWATTHSAFGSDYYVELKKQHPVIR